MYITMEQRRRLTIIGIVIILILLGTGAYYYYPTAQQPSPQTSQQTQTQQKVSTVPAQQEQESEKEVPLPYTLYDEKNRGCVYYYEGGQCYVPLNQCAPNSKTKTSKQLDTKKYCSETPQLSLKSLRSESGVCSFVATEGDIVNLRSIVSDPDAQDPTHPYGPLGKLDVVFSLPFSDYNGVWQTRKGDIGVHNFTVKVTDGEYTREKDYCIEVLQGNRPPMLSNLQDITVVAGETATIDPKCTDPDGDEVSMSQQGDIANRDWMQGNTKKTRDKDIGDHHITVSCSDTGGLYDYKTALIRVVSQGEGAEGILQLFIEPENVVAREGETVTLNPRAESSVGKPVTVTYSGWMTSSSRQTGYDDSGVYTVIVTASDGQLTVTRNVTVTVLNVNRPPEILGTEQRA